MSSAKGGELLLLMLDPAPEDPGRSMLIEPEARHSLADPRCLVTASSRDAAQLQSAMLFTVIRSLRIGSAAQDVRGIDPGEIGRAHV